MPTYTHCSHQNTKVTKLALGIFEYKKFRPYLNKLLDKYLQEKKIRRENELSFSHIFNYSKKLILNYV